MSILKSTRVGRCAVKVDKEYLEQHGWYYKNKNFKEIWKDEEHSLQILVLDLLATGPVEMIIFHETKDIWDYNLLIVSLEQLDDIEKFWRDREIDFEKAESELLKKWPSIRTMRDMQKEMTNDLTNTINARIMKRIFGTE